MSPAKMTHRQRIITALSHEEPDTVPTALGGGPYGIVDELYFRLIKILDLGKPVPPFREGHNISYMDDCLLDRLGTDIRYCWPGKLPNSPSVSGANEETFIDYYGQVWKRAFPYYYADEAVLKDIGTVDKIDQRVSWPDLADSRWMTGVADRARTLSEQTDYFIVMRMVASHGPFQTACDLRGTETFLMDMATNPIFAETLLDKVTGVLEGLIKLAMQAGGKYFDLIELPGDDYAGNNNLIMSSAMFSKFIKPCIKRMVKAIREHNPNIKIMLHSDGAITKLLEEIIDLEIDVIHPLEPLPATDFSAIKERFGQRVSFLGGIDISHSMTGNRDEVKAEVRRRITQLAQGGGYILAPSNHLQADIPEENVITLYQYAHEYGRYPIRVSNND